MKVTFYLKLLLELVLASVCAIGGVTLLPTFFELVNEGFSTIGVLFVVLGILLLIYPISFIYRLVRWLLRLRRSSE